RGCDGNVANHYSTPSSGCPFEVCLCGLTATARCSTWRNSCGRTENSPYERLDATAPRSVPSNALPRQDLANRPLGPPTPRRARRIGDRAEDLPPSQLMQPLLVNAEIVRDLVDHGDGDLLDHLLLVLADVQDRLAVDGDRVGKRTAVMTVALGEGDAPVDAEQARLLGIARLDQNHHIVDGAGQFGRDQIEGVGDQFLEPLLGHDDGHRARLVSAAAAAAAPRRAAGWGWSGRCSAAAPGPRR